MGKRDRIEAQMERVSATPMAQASQASKAEVAQWRAVVQACVPALVAAWEPIMGVKAGQLAYRHMTSSWGSCQPSTGRICINVRLALYPPECLDTWGCTRFDTCWKAATAPGSTRSRTWVVFNSGGGGE